jgi:hypothetical protein
MDNRSDALKELDSLLATPPARSFTEIQQDIDGLTAKIERMASNDPTRMAFLALRDRDRSELFDGLLGAAARSIEHPLWGEEETEPDLELGSRGLNHSDLYGWE